MKKIKMTFMALASITGIGSAFALSPASKRNNITYYAIKSGISFVWETAIPPHVSCQSTELKAACTVTTASMPVDGEVPAGHMVTFELYR